MDAGDEPFIIPALLRHIREEEMITFELVAVDEKTGARAGILHTPHGDVETPVFMPVGTQATVKTMSPRELEEIGISMIVSNTYHLHLRPGDDLIAEFGGLHNFMGWKGAILTDSGGFQVYSLSDLRKVTEDGVTFRSHIDGSYITFTPERVMEIEKNIGADIIMIFDEPVGYPVSYNEAKRALELTLRWAKRALEHKARIGSEQALFGIVQGSVFEDLREKGAVELVAMGFDGYAIGGLALGEPKVEMMKAIEAAIKHLPHEQPRYLMGVGYPEDIVDGVARGVDMFDCVLPTRNSRTGSVFTSRGKLVIKNAKYARDHRPLDPDCGCYVCRNFSRAYIRHLFNAGEILAPRLATYHSLYFFSKMMKDMRKAIIDGYFVEWREEFLARYGEGWE